MKHFDTRWHVAVTFRQGNPKLKYSRWFAPRKHALAMDDAASRGHPNQITGLERTLVFVVEPAFEHEGDGFETGVRVGASDPLPIEEVDPVVHEQNEGVVSLDVGGSEDLDCGVAAA
jgi:hypothetical protein